MVGPIIQTSAKSSDFEALFFSEVDGFFLTCPCHKIKKNNNNKNPWKGLLLRLWWDMIPKEWSELTEVREKEQWRIQGRGLGARSSPFIFRPNNWGLKGPLPPLSQCLDDRRPAPYPSTSPYLKVWIWRWRVSVEAALWIKLLKAFFRLKQLNLLSGKKIPFHFW